jgi:hypothetical protein
VQVLLLSACKRLPDSALAPLHFGRSLPKLDELDVSYCNLSAKAVGDLLAFAPHIARLSFNGCSKLDDTIWARLAEHPGDPPGQTLMGLKFPVASIGDSGKASRGQTEHQRKGLDVPRAQQEGMDVHWARSSEALKCPGESPGHSGGSPLRVEEVSGSPGRVTKRLREVSLRDSTKCRGEVRQRMLTAHEMTSFGGLLAGHRASAEAEADENVSLIAVAEESLPENAEGFGGLPAGNAEQQFEGPSGGPVTESQRAGESMDVDQSEGATCRRRLLTSLSLVGCNGLRSVRIVAPRACPELTNLNFSLSGNVRQVLLACPKLAHLNLNLCGSLGRAEVDCPNLRSLKIQVCSNNDVASECLMRDAWWVVCRPATNLLGIARSISLLGLEDILHA